MRKAIDKLISFSLAFHNMYARVSIMYITDLKYFLILCGVCL